MTDEARIKKLEDDVTALREWLVRVVLAAQQARTVKQIADECAMIFAEMAIAEEVEQITAEADALAAEQKGPLS